MFGGLVSQVQVLKLGCTMWSLNSLLLREKLGVASSLLNVSCCVNGGVYSEVVSQPLLRVSRWVSSSFA